MSGAGKGKSTMIMGEAVRPSEGPAVPDSALVVVIHPPGPMMGRRLELRAEGTVLGSLPESDVSVPLDGVSRKHLRVGRDAGGWFVEDLGSTNGTFVNDHRVGRQKLEDGDLLRAGVAILKFLAGSEIEATFHEAIYRMAIHDALTGIPNRRALLEFMDREVSRCLRHLSPLSLVLFDIDHFKKVNDELGHLAGDAVLREVGARLRPRMRREDVAARYGGEEFACVLTGTDRAGALVFAQSIRMLIGGAPFPLDSGPLRVTVSLGVACIDGSRPVLVDDVIREADANLYEAKRAGRNRVVG